MTTSIDRPKILPFNSARDQACHSCSTPIARGDRAGFDCTTGPHPLCAGCCAARGTDIHEQPAAVRARTVDVVTPGNATVGEVGALSEPTEDQLAATLDIPPHCTCTRTGKSGDGFSNAAGPGEPPRYVHTRCGLPTRAVAEQEHTTRVPVNPDEQAESGSDADMTNTSTPTAPPLPAPTMCEHCAAPIHLVTSPGVLQPVPVDAEPADDGVIQLTVHDDGVLHGTPLPAKRADAARDFGTALHAPHRVACPHLDSWTGRPVTPVVEKPAEHIVDAFGKPSRYNEEVTRELDEWLVGGDPVTVHPAGPPRREAEIATPHAAEQATIHTMAEAGRAARAEQETATPPAPTAEQPDDVGEAEEMPLPDLAPWLPEATQYGGDPNQVAVDFIEAVRLGILAGDLRSRQKELGPSEVGHPCSRWLAHRLAGTPATGTEPTPWRQRVGTLVHADFDDHAHRDNQERGTRWLTGTRVSVGELYPGREIRGTLDCFDVRTGTVLDQKVPGATAMRTYGPGKPESEQYRKQVQLYARGVQRAGYKPAWVGILRVSPARELSEYVWKFERYDEQVAVDALARAGGIAQMVNQLGAQAATLLPPTEAYCHRCPFYRPGATDLTTACPGAPGAAVPRARASVDDLVA